MKDRKYHAVVTIPISSRKILEQEAKAIP